jgi:hypothetical protein
MVDEKDNKEEKKEESEKDDPWSVGFSKDNWQFGKKSIPDFGGKAIPDFTVISKKFGKKEEEKKE